MSTDRTSLTSHRQSGLTLIELVVFIMIVSIALAGVLSVLTYTTSRSADPMISKQMLAIAEALLEEVEMRQFTYCNPGDPNFSTASSALLDVADVTGYKCKATLETLGPESGETRPSTAAAPFNNVNDYYVSTGYQLASPIQDVTGNSAAPPGYTAKVEIFPEALHTITSGTCASATDCTAMKALRIAVTVSYGGDTLTVETYRTRHSPNY